MINTFGPIKQNKKEKILFVLKSILKAEDIT